MEGNHGQCAGDIMHNDTVTTDRPIRMTREALEQDRIRAHFERRHPEVALLSNAEFRASIRTMLETRPAGAQAFDGVFLFAYGSLIWNPCVEVAEQRTARLYGYHRDFRLKLEHGRGSQETPGLMLALTPGGSCRGVALRLPEANLEEELLLVWRREMLTGAYQPRWVKLATHAGTVPAIAFVANPQHDRYLARQDDATTIELLSTGGGVLGSCAEYLHNTVNDLRALGIHDTRLEFLHRAVCAGSGRE